MKRIFALILTLCMAVSCLTALPVFADSGWHTIWNKTNVTVDGDTVTMRTSSSTATSISLNKPANMAKQFDFEFTMKVNTYGDNEHFRFRSGYHHFLGYVKPDSIAGIPYDVGNDWHTYRFIGNGDTACEVYADGYFIGFITLDEEEGTTPTLYFQFTSKNGAAAETQISDVTFHKYSGSLINPPIPGEAEEGELTEDGKPVKKSAEERSLYYDFEEHADGWVCSDGSWFLKDGTWRVENTNSKEGYYATSYLYPEVYKDENFRWEMDIKFVSFSFSQAIDFYCQGSRFTFRPRDAYFEYLSSNNTVTENIGNLLDDKYHRIVVETYDHGDMVRFSVDGVVLVDELAASSSATDCRLVFSVASQGQQLNSMLIDNLWFTILPEEEEALAVEFLQEGSTYLEGGNISIKAKNLSLEEAPPYVEYKIGNEVVATGQTPEYTANLTNLRTGNYEITANYGDATSAPVAFTVIPQVAGVISAEQNGDDMTAALGLYDKGIAHVAEVEFLLDGQSIGKATKAPYTVTASGIYPDRHTLQVVCRDSAGVVLKVFSKILESETGLGGEVSANYANDISYIVTGDAGSASVDFSNGTHRLYLKHTPEGVNYLTNTGEETYKNGTGNFEIITDGTVADVYRNGQMVFSYFMPVTDKRERTIQEDGMTVSDYTESAPKQKNNYFAKRNVQDKGAFYELTDLPFYNNLDFVADKGDEAKLVINDGYFGYNLLFKDGKIGVYTGTLADAKTAVQFTELADALDGKAYYRVEMAMGMCRLYGNGKWLSSFKAIPGGGEGSVYVDVQKGSLDFVGVNDNRDLRIFNDTFEGTGDFDSDRFWQAKNLQVFTLPDVGRTLLVTEEDATAPGLIEWNAFATDLDFGGTIKLSESGKGFWMTLSHSVENSYSKVGYNFETGQYEVVDVSGNFGTETVMKTAPGKFPVGEDVSVSVSARRTTGDNKEIVFYVNGTPVISVDNGAHRAGTFGFMLDGGSATLYDVDYRGDAMIVNGLIDYVDTAVIRTADMVVIDENTWFFMQRNTQQRDYTYDGGKSWQKMTATVVGDNYNCVQLPSGALVGTLLETYGTDKDGKTLQAYTIYYSDNSAASWQNLGTMQEPQFGFYSGQNRMVQTSFGRIFFVASFGEGSESTGHIHRVFYSDDEGKTWKESKNNINPFEMGIVVDEAMIVEVADEVLRCYFRTERGYLGYVESYDRGITWEDEPHRTPLYSAANCFGIEKDPETGYLYAGFGYDNAWLGGMVQHPRSRWSVAVSRDNGENWEFVGTGHENNQRIGSLMMNMGINIAPNHVILSGYSHYDDSNQGGRRIVISKDQVTSKRFDQVHYCEAWYAKSYLPETETFNAMVVDAKTGKVMVQNHMIDSAAEGDAVSMDVAAAFVGAVAKDGENGGVVLQKGTSEVVFAQDKLTEKGGKQFVKLTDLAEAYSLNITEFEDISILSVRETWTGRHQKALQRMIRPAEVLGY